MHLRAIALTLLLSSSCARVAPPVDDAHVDDNPACADRAADFDAVAALFERGLVERGLPGGSIAVVCDARRIFARGFGTTIAGGGAAVDEHTRFNLASVTKVLTAITALSLAEDGTVALDGPASDVLPELNTKAPYDRSFTLAELLAHRSGLPASGDDENPALTFAGYFDAEGAAPLWAPPGAVWVYNNVGYSLAGYWLERAAGRPFRELVDERVLAPLALADSAMSADDDDERVAHGHTSLFGPGVDEVAPSDPYLSSELYAPMGGAWMSAHDLAAVARALLDDDGALLSAQSVRDMATPRGTTYSPEELDGLGLFVDHLGTRERWSHSGSVAGFLSELMLVPDAGFAVVLLVNGDVELPYEVEEEALARFTDWQWRTDLSPPPSTPADALAGSYHGNGNGPFSDVVIAARGAGGLVATFAGDDVEHPLEPLVGDWYLVDFPAWGASLEVVFSPLDEGGHILASRAGCATQSN